LGAENLAIYVDINKFHYKYDIYNEVSAKREDILMRNVILKSKHVKGYSVRSRLVFIHQLLGKIFYTLGKRKNTTDVQNTLGVRTRC
jgi:hypothetical protein